ncbi:hypothetical protein KAI52_00665 [Candidatus Parcubacteria bacterium]|nr:hypothetical protein [Candidatus Parcubacteria bacterium]
MEPECKLLIIHKGLQNGSTASFRYRSTSDYGTNDDLTFRFCLSYWMSGGNYGLKKEKGGEKMKINRIRIEINNIDPIKNSMEIKTAIDTKNKIDKQTEEWKELEKEILKIGNILSRIITEIIPKKFF